MRIVLRYIRLLKKWLRGLLIDFLIKLLFDEAPVRGTLQPKDYIKAMSKLYQNPAFMQYCAEREDYLVKNTINLLTRDELMDAKGVTGQLLELRSLQKRVMTCYYKIRKEN